MIGIVVVSHSRVLAEAAVQLASEMVADEGLPRVAVAAGLDDGSFGTDAIAIAAAIHEVHTDDGVLVFTDVGSAVLAAGMALDFVDPTVAERTRISAAPLVEGLLVALVTASTGATLQEVEDEALASLACKVDGTSEALPTEPAEALEQTFTIECVSGLHARPVATLIARLRTFDAQVTMSNASTGAGPAPATSVTRLLALGVRKGQSASVRAQGPQAAEALEAVAELVAGNFGEGDPAATR